MQRYLVGAAVLALTAGAAQAGGLDRSQQSVLSLFSPDNTFDLSFGVVTPTITGSDALGTDYDVGESYTQIGLSYTKQINDQFALALIFDQPFGADINYDSDPLTSTLGGTMADLNSKAFSAVGKYQLNDRVSVFGGLRIQGVDAKVALNGVAYRNAITVAGVAATVSGLDSSLLAAALGGDVTAATAIDTTYGLGTTASLGAAVTTAQGTFAATNGYNFEMANDYAVGYTLGAAYEIPDIALRLAATYHSEIEHTADTTESLLGSATNSTVTYVTPQSFNLDFQTGIAANTLLMASYRWAEYEKVDVIPTALGSDLVNLGNSQRYTLGIGRKFTDNFSGSITLSYEPEGGDDTVSPLGPTDGLMGITIGGKYTKGNTSISGGINYTKLGDADAGVADTAVASFTDNSVVGIGFKISTTF
ncbi:outer membrane protein transport protein [Thalassovita sp.]|uniref:outer membrane protein transport protein n=1 Tax=Thalassovita sp. TaxID=1979401 RepID=UPI002AB268AF|nr:outer membrane protein transport protein [Thalassovita sp.]